MAVWYMSARSTSVDSMSLGSGGASGTCSRPEKKRLDQPSKTRATPTTDIRSDRGLGADPVAQHLALVHARSGAATLPDLHHDFTASAGSRKSPKEQQQNPNSC